VRWMLLSLLLSCGTDAPSPPEAPPSDPAPTVPPDPAPDDAAVGIVVSFEERAMQRISVRTTRACPDSGSTEWWMANWTPGSYVIRDHAGKVETISASSAEVQQTAKNRWVVACEAGRPVTVQTTLVASDQNVRGNFVAETWATLNAPAAFVLPEPPEGPFDVKLELPEDWPDAIAPLPRVADAPPTFRAVDLDTLIDSPIVVGQLTEQTLTIGAVPHHFVTFGDARTFDPEVVRSEVVDLVEAQHAFWGDVPYREYWFLQALVPTYGGLEHYRSTLMMSSPQSTETRDDTIRWLGLVSHELFHTWNVQRLRPRALLSQDYETEAYTELLWVAEGWTSYYDDVLLARAGILDEQEYLELLGKQIDRLESRPGRLVQSLASASFNAWTKYYQPTPHQLNSTIGYYTKGAVVAFLLDAEIRRATQGRASLDEVARRLRALSEGPPDEVLDDRLLAMGERRNIRGFTPSDVRRVASEVAGRDLSGFFDAAVDRPGELDYGGALQWFGLKLERGEARPHLGVRFERRDGGVFVTGVFRDSPAWRAGLNVGDEIVSLGDRRATTGDLDDLVERCVDAPCALVRSREGRLATLQVQATEQPGSAKLVVDPGASPLASRRRRSWLGQ